MLAIEWAHQPKFVVPEKREASRLACLQRSVESSICGMPLASVGGLRPGTKRQHWAFLQYQRGERSVGRQACCNQIDARFTDGPDDEVRS